MGQVYKNAGPDAARVAGLHPDMDVQANLVAMVVRAMIAPHNRTAHLESSIRVRAVPGRSGVTDRLVESTDPAAMHIEYGHMNRDRTRWVRGIYVFNKAFDLLKRGK